MKIEDFLDVKLAAGCGRLKRHVGRESHPAHADFQIRQLELPRLRLDRDLQRTLCRGKSRLDRRQLARYPQELSPALNVDRDRRRI